MANDLELYPVFVYKNKKLNKVELYQLENMQLIDYHKHHFIKQQDYKRNKKWFDSHNIQQKIFLLPANLHEQVHRIAIKNLTDEEFYKEYNIYRNEILFCRKSSKYE